jgi:16S rRNA (uracil1498-N3)-methyltransferase
MRKTRVFVDAPLAVGRIVPLPDFAADHVLRVLRLSEGAPLTCFNGDGQDYLGILRHQGRGAALAIGAVEAAVPESPLALTLAQSICRGEKMDLVLQKATELGVVRILPLVSERTEVRLDAERVARRLAHWRGVVLSACEQCGRAVVPELLAPAALDALAELAAGNERALLLDPEGEPLNASAMNASPPRRIIVTVGPEGGFAEREIVALRGAGFTRVRLGPRVLRTETAGLAALAALQMAWGDFG